MKNLICVLLALLLCLSVLPAAFAESGDNDANAEGYTVEGEGWTSVVSWCQNGDMNIYGKFYYPEGFDKSAVYPTVIISHGLGSRTEMTERSKWPEAFNKAGFVVYAFDFCGGGRNSLSDGDYMQMSVRTEQADLNAVMDFVESKDYVDKEHLFLLGQSQGGFVSAITAAARPEEVRAMILVYPALCLVDDLHSFVPDLSALEGDTFQSAMGELGTVYARDAYDIDVMQEIAGYTGDVLIIHGLNDKTVPYSYSVEAIATAYGEESSQLLLIAGKKSAHGFEIIYDEGREIAENAGVAFAQAHLD